MAKVELDNGTILYYKPHSLDKNIKYQELYNYLIKKQEFPAGRYNIYLMIPMDGKKKLRIFPVKTKVRWSIIISEWAYICFWDMPSEQQIFMVKILLHMENIL